MTYRFWDDYRIPKSNNRQSRGESVISQFQDKIGCYLTSLETIMDSDKDTERCKRARSLHDRYKKISKTGERPDYRVSREWKKMCEKGIAGPFINHNPTFTGNPLMGNTGSIHGGSFFNVSKRDKEEDQKESDH
ncbi:unnamed protein product [Rhizophagus irregularis]|nr:unnamed protein product [Rhizophagus irregularis]